MTREEMIQILKDADARLKSVEEATPLTSFSVSDPNYTVNHSVYTARAGIEVALWELGRQLVTEQTEQAGN